MHRLLLASLAALACTAAAAAPLPVTAPPVATGPMTAVLAFWDGADPLRLLWDQPSDALPPQLLFDTSTQPIATLVAGFGAAGRVVFLLENLTTGETFVTGTAVDGVQPFVTTPNFADLGLGPLGPAAAAAIASVGPGGLFLGAEAQRGGDDFNDLVVYLLGVAVPGPAALGLFGLGLVAFAATRGFARTRASKPAAH
jgi:hypothetical protein